MIPITRPMLPPLAEYTKLLEEIWASRMLSNFSSFAQRLEAEAGRYVGVPTRVVANCDLGLICAIASLELPRGSSCLVPSFTFNSTVSAAVWNGLNPVFVDIEPATLTIDVADAERAARSAGRVSLILATHVFGVPAGVHAIAALARELGARTVYDAAHAYGSRRDGVTVGSFGDAEVFSLSPTKVVTSGEGGLVCSRDDRFLDRLRLVRAYGFYEDYETKVLGLNAKMSELHAALGVLSLARIERSIAVRAEHVARYRAGLAQVGGVTFQQIRAEDRSAHTYFAVLFRDRAMRDRVEAALERAEVQTKRYFRPCHGMSAFQRFAGRPLPVTDDVYERILCLPLYEELRAEDIDRICETVREAA